jgi:hypothetical protein
MVLFLVVCRIVPPLSVRRGDTQVIFVIDALQSILLLKRVSSASSRQLFFIKKFQSMKIESSIVPVVASFLRIGGLERVKGKIGIARLLSKVKKRSCLS